MNHSHSVLRVVEVAIRRETVVRLEPIEVPNFHVRLLMIATGTVGSVYDFFSTTTHYPSVENF